MMDIDISLRLSAQRALLDAIPNGLRAVSVEAKEQTILFRCIFEDVDSKEKHWELLSVAGTEIISDFSDHKIAEEYLVDDGPRQKIKHLKHLVFMRKESSID